MPEKIKMNYETMKAMTKEFNAAKKQLDETMQAVTKLGKEMEGGALQGQAGETFRGAINGPLVKAVRKLSEKMAELAKDVNNARARLEEGVTTAKSRFQN